MTKTTMILMTMCAIMASGCMLGTGDYEDTDEQIDEFEDAMVCGPTGCPPHIEPSGLAPIVIPCLDGADPTSGPGGSNNPCGGRVKQIVIPCATGETSESGPGGSNNPCGG